MMSLKFKLPKEKDIYCATDLTGMKMNMSGEYFEKMYGDGKKKFIKVTLTGNPYTKDLYEVDVAIEGEELSEPDVAMTHMTELDAMGYNILEKSIRLSFKAPASSSAFSIRPSRVPASILSSAN